MPNAQATFLDNMRDADNLTAIYDYLSQNVSVPMSFDDLLRSKIVYAVSAFDKLIHDLIRVGMVDIFAGRRAATPKYATEPIPLSFAQQLATATTPPAEVIFEQLVRSKLKSISFQDPDKVADGLSYIWNESQKWQRISAGVGIPVDEVRTKLKLIVARRNSIVHEADMDPITNTKYPITKPDSDDTASFLLKIGNEICRLVV